MHEFCVLIVIFIISHVPTGIGFLLDKQLWKMDRWIFYCCDLALFACKVTFVVGAPFSLLKVNCSAKCRPLTDRAECRWSALLVFQIMLCFQRCKQELCKVYKSHPAERQGLFTAFILCQDPLVYGTWCSSLSKCRRALEKLWCFWVTARRREHDGPLGIPQAPLGFCDFCLLG